MNSNDAEIAKVEDGALLNKDVGRMPWRLQIAAQIMVAYKDIYEIEDCDGMMANQSLQAADMLIAEHKRTMKCISPRC